MLHARRELAFFTGQLGCARWACWAVLFFASKSWIFLSFSSNQSWFFFFVCPRISSDVVSIAVFKSSHRVSKGRDVNGRELGLLLQVFLELGFHHPTAQFANVKFLYRAALCYTWSWHSSRLIFGPGCFSLDLISCFLDRFEDARWPRLANLV